MIIKLFKTSFKKLGLNKNKDWLSYVNRAKKLDKKH